MCRWSFISSSAFPGIDKSGPSPMAIVVTSHLAGHLGLAPDNAMCNKYNASPQRPSALRLTLAFDIVKLDFFIPRVNRLGRLPPLCSTSSV